MDDSPREKSLVRAAGVINFIQGEVLALRDGVVTVSDIEWPLSDRAESECAKHDPPGVVVVPIPGEYVVLLTQTCDLQETFGDQIYCQIASVSECTPEFAKEARAGRRPGWVALPWFADNYVAKLSLITTVERSVLVECEPVGRPKSQQERLYFSELVSRHFTRIALPESVSTALSPLLERMRSKSAKASSEGRCVDRVVTIRVEASPDFDANSPDLRVLFILDEENLPAITDFSQIDQERIDELRKSPIATIAGQALDTTNPVRCHEAWVALAESWLTESIETVKGKEELGAIDVEVLSGENFSFARSRNAPELDLAYLTMRSKTKAVK